MPGRERHSWYIKNYDVERQEQPLEMNVDWVGILEDLVKKEVKERGMDAAERSGDSIQQLLNGDQLSEEAIDALEVAAQRAARLGAGDPLEFHELLYTTAKNINFEHAVELERKLGTDNIVDTHPATDRGRRNIKNIIDNVESRVNEIKRFRGHRHSELVWDALDAELRKIEEISELINEAEFNLDFEKIEEKKRKLETRQKHDSGRVRPGLTEEGVSESIKEKFPDTFPLFQDTTAAEQNIRDIKAELEAFNEQLATDLPVNIGYSEDVSNLSMPNAGDYFFEHGVDGTDHMTASGVEDKHRDVVLDRLHERVSKIRDATETLDRVSRELFKKELSESVESKAGSNDANQTEHSHLAEPGSSDTTERHTESYVAEAGQNNAGPTNKEVADTDSVESSQDSTEQSENRAAEEMDRLFDLESEADKEDRSSGHSRSR